MAFTVITPQDLGAGLKVVDKKVVVDVAALNIPVDVKLRGVDIDVAEKKMKFTLSDDTVIERDISDFLVADTDTKVVSGSFADNKVTLVMSAGAPVEIDLADLVAQLGNAIDAKVNPVKSDLEAAKGRLDTAEAKIATLEGKKPTGVKLTSLGDVELGYLVTSADVAGA